MRTIGVVTTSRADYGIYVPVLRAIQQCPDLRLELYVTGMHLATEFGRTVGVVERDGFEIVERIEMLLSSDSPEGTAKSMGLGTVGFAQAFARRRPDILLALGDRFEMHAAVVAAVPFRIPVAHVHGGETTQGAIDESFRHSLTKMSHLHFPATEEYARRICQLGEEPWRVTVSGAPALDNLRTLSLLSREQLSQDFGLELPEGFLLATYHPATLEAGDAEEHLSCLLEALDAAGRPVLFTLANADARGRAINSMLREYAAGRAQARIVDNLGTQGYFSVMALAAAMVGNSSSGIIEAPSFKLPVVNVGSRQQGRLMAANVISVGDSAQEIAQGIAKATSKQFRAGLENLVNPYGDGRAAERIVARLRTVPIDQRLIKKRFCDL
jgi:UDP-hydrolysing UDP-N-acetyl-D-glucosamine 2-epimerase